MVQQVFSPPRPREGVGQSAELVQDLSDTAEPHTAEDR
jgi:hypothetical protein